MRDNGQSIGDLINEFYRMHHRENSLNEMVILESWNSVVGEFIALHTLDLRITKGILYVKVDADSLRNELMFSKSILLKNLNNLVKTDILKDIVII